MADDITDLEGLRMIAWSLEGGNARMAAECRRAANEIERLRADLYHVLYCPVSDCWQCAQIEEARRG